MDSDVDYTNDERFILVYCYEWSYAFYFNGKEWSVRLRTVPLNCKNGEPFLSRPFGY